MSSFKRFEAHLFVCTHLREGVGAKESCALKGSPEFRDQLKRLCHDSSRGWKGRVRVNAAGCLDRCSEGIAAVIYPEGRWLTNLSKDSTGEVLQAMSGILDKPSGERPGN